MFKKILFGMVALALFTILFAACSIKDEASLPKGVQVKMGTSNFIDKAVTIKKGESLTLVDTAASPHIVVNGTWQGTTQKPAKETGAPTVNLNFTGTTGESKSAGPFTTAGTFKLYCTIHQGMDLTVTVQ
jgi:plastocyanin